MTNGRSSHPPVMDGGNSTTPSSSTATTTMTTHCPVTLWCRDPFCGTWIQLAAETIHTDIIYTTVESVVGTLSLREEKTSGTTKRRPVPNGDRWIKETL